jgi:hypothetical protein
VSEDSPPYPGLSPDTPYTTSVPGITAYAVPAPPDLAAIRARVAALEALLTEAIARPWMEMEDGPQFCRYCNHVWPDHHAPDCLTQQAAALGIEVDDRLSFE